MSDTIFAVSSGVGRAAIAIVRLSGPGSANALRLMAGSLPQPRFAQLTRLRDGHQQVLDEALVLYFPAPRSETGEDIVELHLHGGRAVVASVLRHLSSFPGLRPAEPGEFARRALLNGKMDLLDVEALADLIDAETEWQRRQALDGGGDILRGVAEQWRTHLLDTRSDLEAQIDFSDEEDVTSHLDSQTERLLQNLLADMDLALQRGRRAERLRDGFVVALCGPPNAGKSSLLNALAGRDIAIVSAQPGTTRDRIEVPLDLDGAPVILIDTAGLREAVNSVEAEGIRRSRDVMNSADLVLWLSPSDCPAEPDLDILSEKLLVIATKSDLQQWNGQGLAISAKTGAGLDHLLALLRQRAAEQFGEDPSMLTRARHVHMIDEAATALRSALQFSSSPEICAEYVRSAQIALERLTGRIGVEDVLGRIFSRFCVGK